MLRSLFGSKPHTAKIVPKIRTPKLTAGESSILILTNAQIHHFKEKSIIVDGTKRAKVDFYLIKNPGTNNPPFLYATYHGQSEKRAIRRQELDGIHNTFQELRQQIYNQYGISINYAGIGGDGNENTLEHKDNNFSLVEEVIGHLTQVPEIKSVQGENKENSTQAVIDEMELSKGTMFKIRGASEEKIPDEKAIQIPGHLVQMFREQGVPNATNITEQKADIPSPEDESEEEKIYDANREFYENAYDMLTNAQAEKHKKPVGSDSKAFIGLFRFDNEPTTEPTENFLGYLKTKLANLQKAEKLKHANFLTDKTKDEDHLPTSGIKNKRTDNILMKARGLLPTAGLKAIKKPDGLLQEAYFNNEKIRRKRYVDATFRLFCIMYRKLNINEVPRLISYDDMVNPTTGALNKMSNALKDMLQQKSKDESKKIVVDMLRACGIAWYNSIDARRLMAMLTQKQRKTVDENMQSLLFNTPHPTLSGTDDDPSEKLNKAAAEFLSSDKNPFQKLDQLTGQYFGLGVDGGYSAINGISMGGSDRIDISNIDSMFKTIEKDKNKGEICVVTATEAGPKDKGPFFNAKTQIRADKPLLDEWNQKLDEYLSHRRASRSDRAKDSVYRDFKKQEAAITALKNKLTQYTEAETPKDATRLKNEILLAVQELKKTADDEKLKKCLRDIEYQFLADRIENKKLKESKLDKTFFFASENYATLYFEETAKKSLILGARVANNSTSGGLLKNHPFTACYKAIQSYFEYSTHVNKLDAERANVCQRVAYEAISVLNTFCSKNNGDTASATSREINEFTNEFLAILHSQDASMHDRQSSYGLKTDLLTGVATAGVFHGMAGLATRCKNGKAHFGIFHQPTTREDHVANIEKTFKAAIATIIPTNHLTNSR